MRWCCSKPRKAKAILLGIALAVLSRLVPAATGAEHGRSQRAPCIVIGSPSAQTDQLRTALTARYPSAALAQTASSCPDGTQLAFSVGPAALRDVAAGTARYPTISLFVTREEYRNIVGARTDISAIYAEASPSVQLELARGLYQRAIRVAVLLSDATEDLRGVFAASAAQAGLTLEMIHASASSDPARALATAGSFDVLVLVPDPGVLSSVSFRTILESTYRHGEGVIGFSAGQVGAGTLAAPFASLSDILAQLDEVVGAYRSTGELPAPSYPRYWSVAVNESVAHSLDLVVADTVRQLSSRPSGAQEAQPRLPARPSGEAAK